jgi:dienelactone hydrolase
MRAATFVILLALAVPVLSACGPGGSSDDGKVEHEAEPPPQSRFGAPVGSFAGERPKALILLIHGGGWEGENPQAFEQEAALAPIFQKRGFATLTFDYRAGEQGLADAERFYRQARRKVGPDVPVCAYGASAGGHVALMLAARNPDLACAVSLAGPTDLPALDDEPGGQDSYDLAVQAFGRDALKRLSPVEHAKAIKARLMLVAAQNDPLVPVAQARAMAKAKPGTQVIVLPAGDEGGPFIHSKVDSRAATQALVRELGFLAAARTHGG